MIEPTPSLLAPALPGMPFSGVDPGGGGDSAPVFDGLLTELLVPKAVAPDAPGLPPARQGVAAGGKDVPVMAPAPVDPSPAPMSPASGFAAAESQLRVAPAPPAEADATVDPALAWLLPPRGDAAPVQAVPTASPPNPAVDALVQPASPTIRQEATRSAEPPVAPDAPAAAAEPRLASRLRVSTAAILLPTLPSTGPAVVQLEATGPDTARQPMPVPDDAEPASEASADRAPVQGPRVASDASAAPTGKAAIAIASPAPRPAAPRDVTIGRPETVAPPPDSATSSAGPDRRERKADDAPVCDPAMDAPGLAGPQLLASPALMIAPETAGPDRLAEQREMASPRPAPAAPDAPVAAWAPVAIDTADGAVRATAGPLPATPARFARPGPGPLLPESAAALPAIAAAIADSPARVLAQPVLADPPLAAPVMAGTAPTSPAAAPPTPRDIGQPIAADPQVPTVAAPLVAVSAAPAMPRPIAVFPPLPPAFAQAVAAATDTSSRQAAPRIVPGASDTVPPAVVAAQPVRPAMFAPVGAAAADTAPREEHALPARPSAFALAQTAPVPAPTVPLAAPVPTDAAPLPRTGIDLTHAAGLHRMIDHIEALRDTAPVDLVQSSTRIRLIPDALGPVDVAVRRDGDTIQVHFTATEAATRQLIADAQPRLTELAEARGVRIDRATVDGGGNAGQPSSPSANSAHGNAQGQAHSHAQRHSSANPATLFRQRAGGATDPESTDQRVA